MVFFPSEKKEVDFLRFEDGQAHKSSRKWAFPAA